LDFSDIGETFFALLRQASSSKQFLPALFFLLPHRTKEVISLSPLSLRKRQRKKNCLSIWLNLALLFLFPPPSPKVSFFSPFSFFLFCRCHLFFSLFLAATETGTFLSLRRIVYNRKENKSFNSNFASKILIEIKPEHF